mgnify:CR=1 FL=1
MLTWVSKEQWQKLWKHIETTNRELGLLKKDVAWLRWLVAAVFLMVAGGLLKQFLGL